MISKKPLCPDRVRKIAGSFAFIEHRFLRKGFFSALNHHQLMLYFFLVIVSDRNGLSYYSYDKICTLLRFSVDEYILARDALIKMDLIAFDGHLFQVLSLPQRPPAPDRALTRRHQMQTHDPATVRHLIRKSLGVSR